MIGLLSWYIEYFIQIEEIPYYHEGFSHLRYPSFYLFLQWQELKIYSHQTSARTKATAKKGISKIPLCFLFGEKAVELTYSFVG